MFHNFYNGGYFFNACVYMCKLVLTHNVPYREIKYNHEQGLLFFGNKSTVSETMISSYNSLMNISDNLKPILT